MNWSFHVGVQAACFWVAMHDGNVKLVSMTGIIVAVADALFHGVRRSK